MNVRFSRRCKWLGSIRVTRTKRDVDGRVGSDSLIGGAELQSSKVVQYIPRSLESMDACVCSFPSKTSSHLANNGPVQ